MFFENLNFIFVGDIRNHFQLWAWLHKRSQRPDYQLKVKRHNGHWH